MSITQLTRRQLAEESDVNYFNYLASEQATSMVDEQPLESSIMSSGEVRGKKVGVEGEKVEVGREKVSRSWLRYFYGAGRFLEQELGLGKGLAQRLGLVQQQGPEQEQKEILNDPLDSASENENESRWHGRQRCPSSSSRSLLAAPTALPTIKPTGIPTRAPTPGKPTYRLT